MRKDANTRKAKHLQGSGVGLGFKGLGFRIKGFGVLGKTTQARSSIIGSIL